MYYFSLQKKNFKTTKIALHRTRLRFSDRNNFSVGIFYK
ncbi:hypothetical protein [Enterobacter hormaechei]|nr:hypothetical protein [Enterobacter hormaechei]